MARGMQELEKKGFEQKLNEYREHITAIKNEISNVVIGQTQIVDGFLRAIICNGHVLVEGVPGIGKTLLVNTLATITGCKFSRIQFTPDLLPSDIVGLTSYQREEGFYTIKGPIFSNFVLADEINRAPPKVQSALLEAMQERQATIGKETFDISPPFFVLATQNPVEQQGTYPLPEAQVDRFLFKVLMKYPSMDDEMKILTNNIQVKKFSEFSLKKVISPQEIMDMQKDVQKIYLDAKLEKYIVMLIDSTRYPKKYKLKMSQYIEFGASPRASIGLYIAAKAMAFMNARDFVTPQDIKQVAHDVLRHRIMLNYEGQAEGITSDQVIDEILAKVPVP
ncbi:MAG: MoxR family ATPase [Candidatus Woesearchaeota archaeon]